MTDTCPDCGSSPSHKRSKHGYCRYCAEKGGHSYSFMKTIDLDLLEKKVGEPLTNEIVRDCEVP